MVDGRKYTGKKSASIAGPSRSRGRPGRDRAPRVRRGVAAGSPAGRGTLRLALVLGVLVIVNLYVFLWRSGTSLPDVQRAAAAGGKLDAGEPGSEAARAAVPMPRLPMFGTPREPEADAEDTILRGKVEQGDSLGRILKRAGLEPAAADEVIRAVADILDFRTIRAGQTWRIELQPDGRAASFELVISRIITVKARRDDDGKLVGVKDEAATRIETEEIGGRIESSLYASATAAGEDPALVAFFVDVFAYDLDFYNDTHPGDTFRVVVEKEYKDQEFLRYRRILAAEYAGKEGSFRAFYWQAPGSKVGRYYDADGRSVEKSMLKSPLKFARVSSGFNPKRMHPVLHRVKAHMGVDYPAAVGTPVWAATGGRIVSRSYAGGAGNMVVLAHDNGITTLYMHLSKFATGQKVGQYVEAKTVIGYVGTTGLSTGPHLHFGVKQNGKYVDPLTLAPQRKGGVSKKELARFKLDIGGLGGRLARVDIPERPATPTVKPIEAPGRSLAAGAAGAIGAALARPAD
jgi:murein DD-endopeptidase MepM/ murein hydrolase activator NlpD